MKYNRNEPLRGFNFIKRGSIYRVEYESDFDIKVGRYYFNYIQDLSLIDATKNAKFPKRKDIELLRKLVKKGHLIHY